MTSRELAEKIILECPKDGPAAQVWLESLLAGAMEEARKEAAIGWYQGSGGIAEHYKTGQRDAYLDAARVAEEMCQCPHHISIGYALRSKAGGLE